MNTWTKKRNPSDKISQSNYNTKGEVIWKILN